MSQRLKMTARQNADHRFVNTVSHANNRRRRRFLPNLHTQRFWLEGEKRWVSLRVSANAMRTIEKKGLQAVLADLRTRGVKL